MHRTPYVCTSGDHTMARGRSSRCPSKYTLTACNALVCRDYFLRMNHHRTVRALQGRDGGSSFEVGRSHDIILPSQCAPVQFSSQLPSCYALLLEIYLTRRSFYSLLPIVVSFEMKYSFLSISFPIGPRSLCRRQQHYVFVLQFIHAFIQSIG